MGSGLRRVDLRGSRRSSPTAARAHYADCIRAIKARCPQTAVEALTPDFAGNFADVATVVDSGLDVFAQNLETVERLTSRVRDARAGYAQTLAVLEFAKAASRRSADEVEPDAGVGRDGRRDRHGARRLEERAASISSRFGQYLRPTPNHLAVERYVTPQEFDLYRAVGSRARLPRGRRGTARALELSRRPRVREEQRGALAAGERVPRRVRACFSRSSRPSSCWSSSSSCVILASRRRGHAEGLVVEHLNRRFEDAADELKLAIEGKGRYKKAVKARQKERKREDKARAKEEERRSREMFVLDFKGDLRASAAASLREEVSAMLRVAKPGEQVLLRLENSGGTVHEHGFAASQLTRLKQHGLKLAVAVDKVAASGGYLMACVADRLVAAPFAIVGSIGVLAQLPNFHRLLEEKGVDFEQIMAGRYKRTLTMSARTPTRAARSCSRKSKTSTSCSRAKSASIGRRSTSSASRRASTGTAFARSSSSSSRAQDERRPAARSRKDHDLYHIAYKRRRSWQERVLGGAESLLTR